MLFKVRFRRKDVYKRQVKENYQVSVDLSAVGVANQNKFQNTLYKWHSFGVTVKGELL